MKNTSSKGRDVDFLRVVLVDYHSVTPPESVSAYLILGSSRIVAPESRIVKGVQILTETTVFE